MVSEQKKQMLKHYSEGLSLYKTRKFKEALGVFEKALEYEPEDGPIKLYISRCKELIKNPPPLDWDGVYTMQTK